jgi:predicted Zn-dependent protease
LNNANACGVDEYQMTWPVLDPRMTIADVIVETETDLGFRVRQMGRKPAQTTRYELTCQNHKWWVTAHVLLEPKHD